MRHLRPLASLLVLLAAACGGDDKNGACNPVAGTGCPAGLACEPLEAGGGICAAPLVVRGTVTSLSDGSPIAGARVVALDANHAPVSTVGVTDATGTYLVRVSNPRTPDRAPTAQTLFLRADARGHRSVPSGLRQALPITTGDAVVGDDGYVVENAQTDVALEPVATSGDAMIHGKAAIPPSQPGVLVVAEPAAGGAAAGTALADRDGDYAIFNLAPGEYAVKAYARGGVHSPKTVTLVAGENETVDLPLDGPATAAVSGSVQIVNRGAGTGTSVVLVLDSTFDVALGRGETPPGLRAPNGLQPTLTGDYVIEGVPPGKYVALAAFEDDLLVRDPDVCIGGTQTTRFDVADADVTLPGFKVTGALNLIGPGADGPEVVSGTPTFTWQDDSGESAYELTVVNGLGAPVWGTTIAGVSGGTPSVTYGGPALAPGYYQWSVKSSAGTCGTGTKYLARSEDLKGVFVVE